MAQIAPIDCQGRSFNWSSGGAIYYDWLEELGYSDEAAYLRHHEPQAERGFSNGSESGAWYGYGDGYGYGYGYGYGDGDGDGYGYGYGYGYGDGYGDGDGDGYG